MIEEIKHIGIAVKNINESIDIYCRILGFSLIHREIIETRKVEIAFLDGKNILIELVADINDGQMIKHFIGKKGEGLHHIAIQVEDIRSKIAFLRSNGINLIDDEPRIGAHSNLVAFVHPSSFNGVLIELCEDDSNHET